MAPEDQQRHLQDLGHISDKFKDLLGAGHDILSQELTDSEKSFIELQSLLAEELKSILGAGSNLKEVVVDGLRKVVLRLDAKLESFQDIGGLAQGFQSLCIEGREASDRLLARIPDWRFLHESYMIIEVRQFIPPFPRLCIFSHIY